MGFYYDYYESVNVISIFFTRIAFSDQVWYFYCIFILTMQPLSSPNTGILKNIYCNTYIFLKLTFDWKRSTYKFLIYLLISSVRNVSKSGKRYWYLPLYFVPVVTLCIEMAFLPKSCVVRYYWDIKYSMPTSTHSSLEYLTCLLLLNISVSNIHVFNKNSEYRGILR